MNAYVNFVRNHALLVRPVEGLLRTVTFFLPSRFHENGNSEITAEASLAASNVMTLVNDLILLRPGNTAALLPQAEDRIGLVLMLISHTEVLLEKVSMRLGDGAEHLVVLCLEALKALLRLKLLHLQQQQGGGRTKLLLDGGRVIPSFDTPWSPPLPSTTNGSSVDAVQEQEEEEEETLLRVARGGGVKKATEECGPRQEWKRGRRTGRKFLYYASEGNEGKAASDDEDEHDKTSVDSSSSSPTSSSSSSSSSSSASSSSSSTSTLPSLTAASQNDTGPGLAIRSMAEEEAVVAKARARLLLSGEVLHILRPLFFAYLRWLVARRRRSQRSAAVATSTSLGLGSSGRGRPTTIPGPPSSFPSAAPEWLPLLLPALMDAVSHQCTISAIDRNAPLKQSYQDELQRRKNLWLLYLLRTPVFEGLTQPVAGAMDRTLGRVPLMGGLANYGFQALLYVQRHFTLTSGS